MKHIILLLAISLFSIAVKAQMQLSAGVGNIGNPYTSLDLKAGFKFAPKWVVHPVFGAGTSFSFSEKADIVYLYGGFRGGILEVDFMAGIASRYEYFDKQMLGVNVSVFPGKSKIGVSAGYNNFNLFNIGLKCQF